MESLAQEYHTYMTFRAKCEVQKHELPVDWYLSNLRKGVPFFFGIYHDREHITRDIQNPKAWDEFCKIKLVREK